MALKKTTSFSHGAPDYSARSPGRHRDPRNIRPQPYAEHIQAVHDLSIEHALDALPADKDEVRQYAQWQLSMAAEFHDLFKLHPENIPYLTGHKEGGPLPINHWDGGVAHLMKIEEAMAALIVRSHHRPLPDLPTENKRENPLRDHDPKVINETDKMLDHCLAAHQSVVSIDRSHMQQIPLPETVYKSLFIRMLVSCFVDADRYDAARSSAAPISYDPQPLKPKERMQALDRYVEKLEKSSSKSQVNRIRHELYKCCKTAIRRIGDVPIICCDAPVGTGKSPSFMRVALAIALKYNLCRIFVVQPFINLNNQINDVYQKGLLLPNENPIDAIAVHHHGVDYKSSYIKETHTVWTPPNVITTAVQCYETMTAAHPSRLRKLHNLARSVIIFDESHDLLPLEQLPLFLQLIRALTHDYGCKIIMASGTLVRFWDFPEINVRDNRLPMPEIEDVPNIITDKLRKKMLKQEERRINVRTEENPMTALELLQFVFRRRGPRLVSTNTVQISAYLAYLAKQEFPQHHIEHVSTALCPLDRRATFERAVRLLKSKQDFTLFGTPLVNCGWDTSFRFGFQQRRSHSALNQCGGRVKRGGNDYPYGTIWDFDLVIGGPINKHRDFDYSGFILGQMITEGKQGPEFSTEALRREIQVAEAKIEDGYQLTRCDTSCKFSYIEQIAKVIKTNTRTCIVIPEIAEQIINGENVHWSIRLNNSVQIWASKLPEYCCQPIGETGLYQWILPYDNFLGYMSGVIPKLAQNNDFDIQY